MTRETGTSSRATSGLLLGAAGFALLSLGDGVVKSMAGQWPGTAIGALRYVFGAIGLCALLAWRQGRAGFVCPKPGLQLGRGAAVALASAFFFMAISLMPLAEATVIQFANPIIVAILSQLLLGERAPRAAWIATALAFAGVIVVLRPNVALIGAAGLLPLFAAFFMALMVVFNRKAAGLASALQMQMLISVIAAPLLIGIAAAGHASGIDFLRVGWPSWSVVARSAVVAVSASSAHGLIYMATERISAARMAPTTYVQLLVATLIGLLFFGERPDLGMLAGSSLIVAAGLLLWRETRQRA